MSALDVAIWIVHLAVVWLAWPAKPNMRPWVFWLSICAPVLSWGHLITGGLIARKERLIADQEAGREEAIEFLRAQLVTGTPLEQDNAREILAMWGVPEVEQPRPAAELFPVIMHTSEPETIRPVGQWLAVGGLPRYHEQPPSLALWSAGCRCPACVDLAKAVHATRRAGASGFAQALDMVHGQIKATLSIPPGLLLSPEDCPDCEQVEIVQMNGSGRACVVRTMTEHCPLHRS